MDTETKHYLDECARLGTLARERKASADAQARAASITIEQLRARVATLEGEREELRRCLSQVLSLVPPRHHTFATAPVEQAKRLLNSAQAENPT